MRVGPLLAIGLLVVSLLAVPQPVGAAEDKWPDSENCGERFVKEGYFTGILNTPHDDESLSFRIERGEVITLSWITAGEQKIRLYPSLLSGESTDFRSGEISILNISNIDINDNKAGVAAKGPFSQASITIIGEESVSLCLSFESANEWEQPTKWNLSIARSTREPLTFQTTELRQKISSLQSKLDQKSQRIKDLKQRISSLQSKLDQKKRRIQKLKTKLESQTATGGDVTIKVAVTPASGNENFVAGSVATVKATVAQGSATLSDLRVVFGGQTYNVDSSGKVAIPLAEAGTQTMKLTYQGTTKSVTLDVQQQGSGQQDGGQQQTGGQQAAQQQPGFSAILAVTALALLSGLILLRRNQ